MNDAGKIAFTPKGDYSSAVILIVGIVLIHTEKAVRSAVM